MSCPPDRLLDWLFLDLNSYFASCEQQENPALRGKPVIVVPLMSDFTCAIAASQEAKKFGIRTGTNVREAKQKCPGLICVQARHRVYVDYHDRVIKEVEHHIPVFRVESIDEMSCELTGKWRLQENALEMARRIKEGLRRSIGEAITCSVGLSTNRYLAKVATDLQKPDGLIVLRPSELPDRLMENRLTDFPGIGRNMAARLARSGIFTFDQLWDCPPKQLRGIWGGVGGERFWHALRGVEIPEEESEHGSVGHSQVLSPAERPPELAELVARRLLLRAASRLRRMKHLAGCLTISARMESGARCEASRRLPLLSDSVSFQEQFTATWRDLERELGRSRIKKIGVTLHELVEEGRHTQLELFAGAEHDPARQEELEKRARLSQAIDLMNDRFGRDAITVGIVPGAAADDSGPKIAFSRMPVAADFERD